MGRKWIIIEIFGTLISSNQYTTPSTHQFQLLHHTINISVPTSTPQHQHFTHTLDKTHQSKASGITPHTH